MKKLVIPFFVFLLICFSSINAQVLADYVAETIGDTLVIKDYTDMGGTASSLLSAIELDTEAPAGRVYKLKQGGWYPLSRGFTTPAERAIVIVGEDNTRLVVSENSDMPPLISGYVDEGTVTAGGMNIASDLTLKNLIAVPKADNGELGWAFFQASTDNNTLTLENVLMEGNRWIFIQSNENIGTSVILKDCYFVNMSGQPCRRNGGIYDAVSRNTKLMWVENCTHIMAQGMMYKFRNYAIDKAFFNHNTFINCTSNIFESYGYQSNMIITNNIFINSNIQAHSASSVWVADQGELDQDALPHGLINLAPLPDALPTLDRKVLVDGNLLYFATGVNGIATTLNTNAINNVTDWVPQSIPMNSRTEAMFNNDSEYPYLVNGLWYDVLPDFTNPGDLLTDQFEAAKTFSILTVDTSSTGTGATATLPYWRTPENEPVANFIYPDWPIPVDLSYSNTEALAGVNGFPVGDLNWFPDQKDAWLDQRDAEIAQLEAAKEAGEPVLSVEALEMPVSNYRLDQNFPNPFNPSTTITFAVPEAGNVTLKVYDVIGKEVATLVNGQLAADTYKVSFDAASLSSGVYLYTLSVGNFTQTKKMVLMK